ncbi:MAG: SCP2 sterol-binding domain-containing protein [Acetatifactor sp.]|nr:SCP2 sterol-binding domain-containing protein [Acetatifactor sp.]MDE5952229.1 SCP2 sterol-binding domain-containing protein [Acetatifactor sp.]
MTYQEVFEKFKNQFKDADVSSIKGRLAYQFNIVDEGAGAFYVEVNDGRLSIEPYEYYDRDVLFTCKADVLFKIISGKIDPVAAFTLGKLKVEGSIEKALLLKNMIK